MKGRKPNIAALPGALDKAPPAPTWLPKFAKAAGTRRARAGFTRTRNRDRSPVIGGSICRA
jgi:hypothetical protein